MSPKKRRSGALAAAAVAALGASLVGSGGGPAVPLRASLLPDAGDVTAGDGADRSHAPSAAQEQSSGAEALLRGLAGTPPVACELVVRSLGNRWGASSVNPRVHPPLAGTPSERETARWAWTARPDAADATALLSGLEADDACVQRVSARMLGLVDDPSGETSARQVEVARSGSGAARLAAIASLAFLADEAASTTLEDLLDADDPAVRRAAAWALSESGDDGSVAGLGRALRGDDTLLSENAAWALGRIESRDALGPLEEALQDARIGVRVNAAWALGSVEDAAAIPSLAAVVGGDDVDEVRRTAAWALGRIEK